MSPTGRNEDPEIADVEDSVLYHVIDAPFSVFISILLDWNCTPGHNNCTDSPVGAGGVTVIVPYIWLECGVQT